MLERFTWFRQSAMRYADDELTLYIDPWGTRPSDAPADVILITHVHCDHFQPEEIERLSRRRRSSSPRTTSPGSSPAT